MPAAGDVAANNCSSLGNVGLLFLSYYNTENEGWHLIKNVWVLLLVLMQCTCC